MKRNVLLVAGLAVFGAAPALAQSSQCPSGTTNALGIPDRNRATQDACLQSIDLFQYLAPQLATALAGGNATLGQGGSLGGLGHFTIGVRANAVLGTIPQIDQLAPRTNGGTPSRQFPTKDSPIPLPTADAAIGLFKGIPLGLTNVGGVDAIVSASYIPKITQDQVTIDPDNPLKLGFGVRVSALQESLVIPGVSITYLKRDLPKINITGTSGNATLHIDTLKVETTAWRVVASKSLVVFGIAAGVGQDKYSSGTTVQATVTGTPIGTQTSDRIVQAQDLTRTTMFADLSLNLPLFKIVGEVGQVSGGTITTFNSFASKTADASRLYVAAGLRFGW